MNMAGNGTILDIRPKVKATLLVARLTKPSLQQRGTHDAPSAHDPANTGGNDRFDVSPLPLGERAVRHDLANGCEQVVRRTG